MWRFCEFENDYWLCSLYVLKWKCYLFPETNCVGIVKMKFSLDSSRQECIIIIDKREERKEEQNMVCGNGAGGLPHRWTKGDSSHALELGTPAGGILGPATRRGRNENRLWFPTCTLANEGRAGGLNIFENENRTYVRLDPPATIVEELWI